MSQPRVLYEDNHLLALEKPAGMPCVPDASGDESLLDWGNGCPEKRQDTLPPVGVSTQHEVPVIGSQ